MKNRNLTIFCFIIIVSVFYGCSNDPNEKANELYVEASELMQSVKVEAKSYFEALELYSNARKKLERISSKYGSSNLAVSLLSGQTRISGFTLSEFEKLEGFLKPLAEAEKKPLTCALLVAETIEDKSLKASAFAELAGKYVEAGQKEKAAQLLSQALKTAKTIEDEFSKARALAQIARSYDKAGQKEKAVELLSQALKTAKTIEDEFSKAVALGGIAGDYAEAGQFTQALETAKTIEDKSLKAWVSADIAGKYAKAGQKEKAVELLSQALKTAKTIEGKAWKASPLAEIAGSYAEAGQFTQAIETAKTIEDKSWKGKALTEIAAKFSEAGQDPSENAITNLRDIVHAAKPMRVTLTW